MLRLVFTYGLLFHLLPLNCLSQFSTQSAKPRHTNNALREVNTSWQRLNLWLGATFLNVAKEGQINLDTCLHIASRSMGLSLYPILAEGIDAPELYQLSKWIDKHEPHKGRLLLSNATGKKRLHLLLLLGSYYAFQSNSYDKHLDSVEYFLSSAIHEGKLRKEEKLVRQAHCLLVKVYSQGDAKKADSLCKLLINQCRQAGDKETEAKVLTYRSKYTPPTPATLDRKISDIQTASELYHSIGDYEGKIHALTDLGYLIFITGNLQAAQKSLLQALKVAEAIQYPYTHYITHALATVSIFQGKFGEPLRYVYQTIKTAENTRDSLAWSYFYTHYSLLLNSEGRTKEGVDMALKSVNRFVIERNTSVYQMLNDVVSYWGQAGRAKEALELTQNIVTKVGTPVNSSELIFYHGVFSTCYLNLKLPDLAEFHIKKLDSLETIAEAYRGPLRRNFINTQFAYLYIIRKQYKKARELLEKNFQARSPDAAIISNQVNTYRWLLFIDSALQDNTAAVAHYRTYIQLLDSSFNIMKIRQAEELQVVYQLNEKENQISLLTQQAHLEKAQLEKAALLRNLMFVGIFATLIISGLLYRQNYLRKRNSKVISEKNEQLQQLLADKEWLLKEVHHRVKNNLQIVMSLLDSQSEFIDDDAALTAIEDNMRRVHAMALIHQKLYQSDDIASIAMSEYINELVSYVQASFELGRQITFEQAIEPIDLDVSQAIPIGLIINESIVNAIKYAFADGRKGKVSITFYKDTTDHLVLKISDNGMGLPTNLDTNAHKSLGFDMMQGLTKQLNGSFTFESNDGLHITIRFAALSHYFSHKAMINFQEAYI